METTLQLVTVMKNQAITTSRIVAEYFHKNHFHVVRDIDNLIAQVASVKQNPKLETPPKMFQKSTYTNEQNGQTYPMYLMNRDGFTLLAMGFTGKKALQFKLAYIDAFNTMEAEIQRINLNKQNAEWLETRKDVKVLYRKMTDSLKVLVDCARAQGSTNADKLYMTYNKLSDKSLGIQAGQRDSLTIWQLHEIEKMQSMIETIVKGLIAKGVEYHEIYQQTKATIESYSALAYFNGTHAALRSA